VLSSLLVFDSSATGPVEGIKFVDCRSKWSNKPKFESADGTQTRLRSWLSRINSSSDDRYLTTVKLDELDANDFNLLVDRYVIDPKVRQQRQLLARQETIPLDDIAELYRPQVIKSSPESRWPTIDQVITIREVATGDIHYGIVGKPDKEIDLWAGDINQIERAILRPGDILISIKGKVGVAGVVPAEAPSEVFGAWLAGQPFVIARLRRSAAIANPVVVARYLTSPNGQAQLWALAGGTTVSFIQMADLRRLAIPLPTVETQQKIIKETEKIGSLRQTIRDVENEIAARERYLSDLFFEAPNSH
jgi:type I restriction enzyme M protein